MTTSLSATTGPRVPGLGATFSSEWTKLRTVRSTWATLGVALLVSVGLSLLFTLANAASFDELSTQQRAAFTPGDTSMVGMSLGLILFAVFGVLLVSGEYASGMIRLSLTITPKRGRVLTSKVLLAFAVAFTGGTLFAVVSFGGGQAMLGGDGLPHLGFGDPGVLRAMFGWGLQAAGFALIAVALGVLLRSAAGAIATSIGIIFAPLIVSGLLSDWLREHIMAYLPSSAAGFLGAIEPDVHSPEYLTPGIAGLVLAGWVVVLLGAAHLVMRSRDSG
ncbi:ABC transporter permease [Amycolatopsis minnesotensis]|uniref:ABC transporter permease subunit n=1 Tax=Amycolatopsis minnesotensis TaxID=337894 RepID=A0ABN2QGY5_9PSEU